LPATHKTHNPHRTLRELAQDSNITIYAYNTIVIREISTTPLRFRRDYATIPMSLQESRRVMYDDYDFDYSYSNDSNLDEDSYADYGTSGLDEDYARDTQDYEGLAYRHYA